MRIPLDATNLDLDYILGYKLINHQHSHILRHIFLGKLFAFA